MANYSNLPVHLLTYGGGARRYVDAVDRLCAQAESTRWFRTVTGIRDQELLTIDEEWTKKNIDFIKCNKRGHGYWIWKPFLIYSRLKNLPAGHILFYVDAGCELNPLGFRRFTEYVEKTEEAGIFAFRIGEDVRKWTKMDLIRLFLFDDVNKMIDPNTQIAATILGFKWSPSSYHLLRLWSYYCELDNYHFVDDSKSAVPEAEEFVEHRHDQAIFSLLVDTLGVRASIIPDESYHMNLWEQGLFATQMPFASCRNISSKQLIPLFRHSSNS
jgi:hypothetical protein